MVEQLKDKLLDGRWKYLHRQKHMLIFENIYNHSLVELSDRQVRMVLDGKDTVSHIQTRRIGNERKKNSPHWWCNGVNKAYSNSINKYKK